MTKPQWTAQQYRAIKKVDSDVLLTASAGSGKTAVLSERYLNLLIDPELECGVDRILVMTFTNDAVAEMRKRIGDRLAEYVSNNPSDGYVRRQLSMFGSARICTLDSFSSSLLKEFFYLAGVDPSFDIIEPSEKRLVCDRIFEEVLEEYYSGQPGIEKTADFYRFVQAYGGRQGDSQLSVFLAAFSRFMEITVDSDRWLSLCFADNNSISRRAEIFNRAFSESFSRQLSRAISELDSALVLVSDHLETVSYFTKFLANAVNSLRDLERRLKQGLDDRLADTLSDKKNLELFARVPNKPKDADEEQKELVAELIKSARGKLEKIVGVFRGNVGLKAELLAADANMAVIRELYQSCYGRYEQFKRDNNFLDYSDLSHKVLDVLVKGGELTAAAIEQRRIFSFILVDEYQDISPLQETLLGIIKNDDGSGNMFMVGDVKQSIYRFRQARPEIILEKHNRFTPVFDGDVDTGRATPAGGRIELNKNFRSRREIVTFVNHIFSRTMTADFGGINYAQDGVMGYGAEYYDQEPVEYLGKHGTAVEFHLADMEDSPALASESEGETEPVSSENDISPDGIRCEAMIAAERIISMVGLRTGEPEFEVFGPDIKKARPVRLADIAILLRSLKSQAPVYAEVFNKFGIPFYLQQEAGLLDAVEVDYIVSVLMLVDNPCQDIPLAAVLRGPLVGLSEEQLAEIRSFASGYYYNAVLDYCQLGSGKKLVGILADFLKKLDSWRTIARSETLAVLLRRIYRSSGLLLYYRGAVNGRQRYANLLHLYEVACEFDTFSSQGLGRFLRHLENLREADNEFGPARILTAADNVVQIMSVHNSKGLEFPVVIVAGLGKKFNTRSTMDALLFTEAEKGGFALKQKSDDGQESYATLSHYILAQQEKIALLHEELRIEYVALTRAREHLILIGNAKSEKFFKLADKRNKQKMIASLIAGEGAGSDIISAEMLESAGCPLDWFALALADHRAFLEHNARLMPEECVGTTADFAAIIHRLEDIDQSGLSVGSDDLAVDIDSLVGQGGSDSASDNSEIPVLVERVKWLYPNRAAVNCGSRAGVTQLNAIQATPEGRSRLGRLYDEQFSAILPADFNRRPAFMEAAALQAGAAEQGTWTHRFIELLDLAGDLSYAGLEKQLENMVNAGQLSQAQAKSIDLKGIESFFRSPAGEALTKPDNASGVFREWEFTLSVPAAELYQGGDPVDGLTDDKVIVRGIIDLLFWNGGSYEIIDFKTDNIAASETSFRAEKYRFQLEFYRRAVQEITGRPVSLCRLFFLKPSVSVDLYTPCI